MKSAKKINLEQVDEQILDYLKVLVHKNKMDKLPPDILAGILLDLYNRFEKFVFLSVVGKLSKEGMEQFDKFVESNPEPKESQAFLKKNVVNYNQVIKEAMFEFEKIYLAEK